MGNNFFFILASGGVRGPGIIGYRVYYRVLHVQTDSGLLSDFFYRHNQSRVLVKDEGKYLRNK